MTIGDLTAKIVVDGSGAVTAFTQVGDASKSAEGRFNSLLVAGTALFAGLSLAVTDFASKAASKMDVAAAFVQQFNDQTGAGLNLLKSVTKNTVDDFDLLSQSNRAAFQGVTTNVNQLAVLWELARAKSKETGMGIQESFDQLVQGVTLVSQRILKQYNVELPDGLDTLGTGIDSTAKKQIILNAVMQAANNPLTQYEANTVSAADRIKAFTTENQNLEEELGAALVPTLNGLLRTIQPVVSAIAQFAQTNPEAIQSIVRLGESLAAAAVITGVLGRAIPLVQGFFIAIKTGAISAAISTAVLTGGLTLVIYYLSSLFAKNLEAAEATNDTTQSFKNLGTTGVGATDALSGALGGATDKLRQMRDAIDEENAAFQEQAASIISTRKQDLADSKDSLDKQTADFMQKQKDMSKAYEDKVSKQKEANQQSLMDLETSFGSVLIKGSTTYDKDYQNYLIATKKQKEANQQKLDAIDQDNKDQTEKEQKKFDESTSALKKKIDEDEGFLKKHAEFIKTVNDTSSKDELDKLFETHQKRLDAIQKQAGKEQGIYDGLFKDVGKGFDTLIGDMNMKEIDWGKIIGKTLKQAAFEVVSLVFEVAAKIQEAIIKMNWAIMASIQDALGDKEGAGITRGISHTLVNDVQQSKYANVSAFKKTLGLAEGGMGSGWTLVGEHGAEMVNLPAGSQVIPNGFGHSSTSTSHQNNYNSFYIDRSVDQDVFMNKFRQSLKFS